MRVEQDDYYDVYYRAFGPPEEGMKDGLSGLGCQEEIGAGRLITVEIKSDSTLFDSGIRPPAEIVNIGTEEDPIMVPKHALEPSSDRGNEFWEMVATGSIFLSEKELDALLEYNYPKEQWDDEA